MNFSLVSGLVLGISVLVFVIAGEVANPAIFLKLHGIIIVVGGTIATALMCFSFTEIKNLILLTFRILMGSKKKSVVDTINEITELAQMTSEGQSITEAISELKNPFLRESLELFEEGTLRDEELFEVLNKRVEWQNEKYKRDGKTLKILGKFPPAFGLIGATMGMIALLQGLGSPDAFEQLGPAMSVALTATFWGLIIANLGIIPMAENLSMAADDDLIMRFVVIEGVQLLRDKKHPLLVEEYLKSYLSPTERKQMKNSEVEA